MADDADRAQERAELEAELEEKYGKPRKSSPKATGFCLECGARLPHGQRWCDAECRDSWEYYERFGAR